MCIRDRGELVKGCVQEGWWWTKEWVSQRVCHEGLWWIMGWVSQRVWHKRAEWFTQHNCDDKDNYCLLFLHPLQDMQGSKVLSDEAANIYERAISGLMKHSMLIYFAYADFEEVKNFFQPLCLCERFSWTFHRVSKWNLVHVVFFSANLNMPPLGSL